MTQKVLVLGASGRFGRHMMQEFERRGWDVVAFRRGTDDLMAAARDVDVIVFGWHLKYSEWREHYAELVERTLAAARVNNATLLFPGNVYNYGQNPDPIWGPDTQVDAVNDLCAVRIETEETLRQSGVQTIIVRSGDYIDTHATGTWFDMVVAKKLSKGVLTYPGDPNAKHAWGFLPDVARAAVDLAERRDDLPVFNDICVPGYAVTANELAAQCGVISQRSVRVTRMSWWFFYLAAPVWKVGKHIIEMSYLWSHPHELDGRTLAQSLPDFRPTPLGDVLRQAICIK